MTTTTEPETSSEPEPAPKPRSLRRRVLSRISIQSKLLVMLLVTSILSAAVVGFIGYQSGRNSLRVAEFDALTARYGTDEYIQFAGQVPKRMTFVVSGRVLLVVAGDDGAVIPVLILEGGDFLGQTALTREPVSASAYALEEVTALQVERDYIEDLVARKPLLLQDIGRAIEARRAGLRRALAAADD